jgi:hypothetical protein
MKTLKRIQPNTYISKGYDVIQHNKNVGIILEALKAREIYDVGQVFFGR